MSQKFYNLLQQLKKNAKGSPTKRLLKSHERFSAKLQRTRRYLWTQREKIKICCCPCSFNRQSAKKLARWIRYVLGRVDSTSGIQRESELTSLLPSIRSKPVETKISKIFTTFLIGVLKSNAKLNLRSRKLAKKDFLCTLPEYVQTTNLIIRRTKFD